MDTKAKDKAMREWTDYKMMQQAQQQAQEQAL
jgi:hypothetical protein